MNNSLRLFVVSVIILGLFTQVLSQNLDLLKELTIYKDSLNSKSGERVEAMRRIETHFSKENLHETAKILIKDAANTVLLQDTDPYVQREGLISIGKMLGGGKDILRELLFEDPPFFTTFTTNIIKARFIVGVMGDLQLDDMRNTLLSYVDYIVEHPDLFPLTGGLEGLEGFMKIMCEAFFFLNHTDIPRFFINKYLEEDQSKKNIWTFLLMNFVRFQQHKHSKKRPLVIDTETKANWKILLNREALIQREHDDFFIALHLLLMLSSNMTITEIMDYKAAYYMDYYTELSKKRVVYLDEAMDKINELYRIHLSPTGQPEGSEGSGEQMVTGFTELSVLFLEMMGALTGAHGSPENNSENSPERNENIKKYNEISRWLADYVESVRFPRPKP